MSKYLEMATLQGELSTVPGIPNRNIKVDVFDDGPAVVLKSTNGRFGVAIPYDQLKQAYAFSQDSGGLTSFASFVFTLGMWPTDDWFVFITWYSAHLDMDVSVILHIGNSANGPLAFKRRAI